jgi:hypothetical protein
MMRRFHEALLLAVLLVAVQTAILAHGHDDAAPSGAAAQSCEFCAGHPAAAPAPEAGGPTLPGLGSNRGPVLRVQASRTTDVRAAHRSRAPPAFHSV